MTREETIKLIGVITIAYPNFDKFRDEKHVRSMVNVWSDIFSEDEGGLVAIAVKHHISTSKWPPSIAEIRDLMTNITNPNIIPPDQAWELVSKYLLIAGEFCHKDYHADLPKAIAESIDAIGYGQLYALHVAYARGYASKAGLDRVTFLQVYEEKVERQRRATMLPKTLRHSIEAAKLHYEDGTKKLLDDVDRRYEAERAFNNAWRSTEALSSPEEALLLSDKSDLRSGEDM